MLGDEPVEQAHAIAGRALGIGRAVLVVPGHARDIEMRPGDALVHETLEELRRGDRPGLARADILDVGDRTVEQLVIGGRSEEHTSELQSLMRSSYAVLCLK